MLERRGTIINVSSVVTHLPGGGAMDYTVPKAALSPFSKALADELGPKGVRVTTISPGPVRTAFWDVVAASNGADRDELASQLPSMLGASTGRMTEPEEVAALIAFVASEHAASILGADTLIDGGVLKAL